MKSAASLPRVSSVVAAVPAPSRDARPQGRPLVILHTITRLDRGGSSDCTLLQAIGAARRGHDVTLASGPSDDPSPLLDQARRQRGRMRAWWARVRARFRRPVARDAGS